MILNRVLPLTPSLVTTAKEGSIASFEVGAGKVAISIPITSLTSVSYGLQPQDHVNIMAAVSLIDLDPDFQTKLPNFTASVLVPGPTGGEDGGTSASTMIQSGGATSQQGRTELDTTLNQPVYVVPSESQRSRLVSQTLVQDAVVLWVGEFPEDGNISQMATPVPDTAVAEGEAAAPATPRPTLITLIVSPQDAVTLNYLMLSNANLNLALRGAGDNQLIETEAVTLQFIMDQYKIPYPTKLPYGLESSSSNNQIIITP